eukprot:gene11849-13991_t
MAMRRNWCDICRGDDDLFPCTTCPRKFHSECAKVARVPEPGSGWQCQACNDEADADEFDGRHPHYGMSEQERRKATKQKKETAARVRKVNGAHQLLKSRRGPFLMQQRAKLLPFVTEKQLDRYLAQLPSPAAAHRPGATLRIGPKESYIHAELREYQVGGVNWILQQYGQGVGGILADEMGLGKTVQTLSFLATLKHKGDTPGPHLVITPLAVLQNWVNELKRFTPSLTFCKVQGNMAERDRVLSDPEVLAGEFDVYLTTYETVMNEEAFFTDNFLWHTICIDEGHRIKNENSKLCGALGRIRSPFRLLLTGTPLQNSMHELYALLCYILPEVITDASVFDRGFAVGQEVDRGVLQQARTLLEALMLRRIKADVDLQAQDRAHRIGQKKQVRIFRFVSEGTAEERVVNRAEQKMFLDAMVVKKQSAEVKAQLDQSLKGAATLKMQDVDINDEGAAIGDMEEDTNLSVKELLSILSHGAENIFRTATDSGALTSAALDQRLESIMGRERRPSGQSAGRGRSRSSRGGKQAKTAGSASAEPSGLNAEPASEDEDVCTAKLQIEYKVYVPLVPLQRRWYQRMLTREAGTEELLTMNQLMSKLTQLMRVCNHPKQLLFSLDRRRIEAASKLRRAEGSEYAQQKVEAEMSTNQTEHAAAMETELRSLTGEALLLGSGKLALLDRMLLRLQREGSRVLLFSQWTQTLDVLEEYVRHRFGLPSEVYLRLDGSTNRISRELDVRTFNAAGSRIFLYLISTKAGGQGINLATADTVVLYDSCWNPQVEGHSTIFDNADSMIAMHETQEGPAGQEEGEPSTAPAAGGGTTHVVCSTSTGFGEQQHETEDMELAPLPPLITDGAAARAARPGVRLYRCGKCGLPKVLECQCKRGGGPKGKVEEDAVVTGSRSRAPPKRFEPPSLAKLVQKKAKVKHDGSCFNCLDGGDVIACGVCPRVYHLKCVTCPLAYCFDCCPEDFLQRSEPFNDYKQVLERRGYNTQTSLFFTCTECKETPVKAAGIVRPPEFKLKRKAGGEGQPTNEVGEEEEEEEGAEEEQEEDRVEEEEEEEEEEESEEEMLVLSWTSKRKGKRKKRGRLSTWPYATSSTTPTLDRWIFSK